MSRRLSALLLAAAVLGPLAPAAAEGGWVCSFYKWDESAHVWWRMAVSVDERQYESTHVHGRDYHCKANCLPVGVPPEQTLDDLGAALAPVADQLAHPIGGQLWVGPGCPPGNLPPEPAKDWPGNP